MLCQTIDILLLSLLLLFFKQITSMMWRSGQNFRKQTDNLIIELNQTKFSDNQVRNRCGSIDFSLTEQTFAHEHII